MYEVTGQKTISKEANVIVGDKKHTIKMACGAKCSMTDRPFLEPPFLHADGSASASSDFGMLPRDAPSYE